MYVDHGNGREILNQTIEVRKNSVFSVMTSRLRFFSC